MTEKEGEAGMVTPVPGFGMALCNGHTTQAEIDVVMVDPEHLRLLTADID